MVFFIITTFYKSTPLVNKNISEFELESAENSKLKLHEVSVSFDTNRLILIFLIFKLKNLQ